MRAHDLSSDRKPEAKTGTIGATPIAEGLKQVARALRNAPTFVFDLDHQSLAPGLGPEHHRSTAGVCLKAFCNRFITADASSCGSASTVNVGSTGSRVNRMCRCSE